MAQICPKIQNRSHSGGITCNINMQNEEMLFTNVMVFILSHLKRYSMSNHRHLCVLATPFLTDMYVKDIQTKICEKDGEPAVVKETAATALVDGKNLLGPVVGNFCMNLAIKKAKDVGIGWVVAHSE